MGIGNGILAAGEAELALRGEGPRGRSEGRRALVDPEAAQDGAHGGSVGDDGEDLSVVSAVGAPDGVDSEDALEERRPGVASALRASGTGRGGLVGRIERRPDERVDRGRSGRYLALVGQG